MMRLTPLLAVACACAVTSTYAMGRIPRQSSNAMHLHHRCDRSSAVLAAGPSRGYKPCKDSNAVFVEGTYAGSDPDPRIRAALVREFGRI
jgi:hypothetical protein